MDLFSTKKHWFFIRKLKTYWVGIHQAMSPTLSIPTWLKLFAPKSNLVNSNYELNNNADLYGQSQAALFMAEAYIDFRRNNQQRYTLALNANAGSGISHEFQHQQLRKIYLLTANLTGELSWSMARTSPLDSWWWRPFCNTQQTPLEFLCALDC